MPVWLLWGNVCVGGLAFGGSCLWSELARWCYTRTFGTPSAGGACVPMTVAVAPQSWVMDIYQPLRGCRCVMPAWCWLVGRGGVCLCGCCGAMCVGGVAVGGSCLWCELVRWCYTRTSGTLSAWGVVPTTVAVAPQSWVMDIYQPLRGCLCVMPVWCWLVGRGGACLCMPVWVLLGGEVVFLVCGEIVGSVCWRYTRTFGTLSAWGLCAHDRNCRSSVVGYISAPLGLSLCVSLVVGGDIDWGRLRCSVFLLCYCFYKIS